MVHTATVKMYKSLPRNLDNVQGLYMIHSVLAYLKAKI